jgi:rod shape-determining protein MreC
MAGHKVKTFIGLSTFLALVILLHFIGALRFLENIFRSIIRPVSSGLYEINLQTSDQTEVFKSTDDLKKAYTEQLRELSELRTQNAEMIMIKEENKSLRNSLNFFASTTYTKVGAEVIGKNIDPTGSTIIVNRGIDAGVKIGDAAVVENGVFVGKVARVEKNEAVVRLVNDNQSRVAATINNFNKSIGIVEGGYGISIRLNFIPQNETVSVGDTVLTSGLEDGIPRGLPIGRIEVVEKEAYQPFQKAVMTPFVALDKIFTLNIITSINYQ